MIRKTEIHTSHMMIFYTIQTPLSLTFGHQNHIHKTFLHVMENRKLRGTFLASKEIIYNYFNNYFIFIYNLTGCSIYVHIQII